ncbi:NAD-dependent dehydratase [Paraburkholderia graminis]|uniref:NAD-dependent epimerase/dehydratase n=1 Tax=Paraburkholderia graminis (strain ATCC 700544 / DSM 17151 / LMG 18924 / NCIMB 13744 / C4D1M) TaxID=396598 RepID=B1FXJ9_PARG4|nr:SDR family oxidoreductase [Paraburkholderia graminis]AXF07078.1 NAD-dependent dehydratase [Paraburkholderia graminis]EDT11542.1 NAD-dependent epimerase/dehydratase [Paraburkholderia graminis C4D1M]CAB3670402.1 N-acetyl-alpha-D-glucosaminyl-diphospho-ditrans, octacis-undecaprenol 4-epimerase [Paraburkholderia graminis C4D1M]
MTQRVLVTGANGFVGKAVCKALLQRGDSVTGLVRRAETGEPGVREWCFDAADFENLEARWPADLSCDAVIHLAARVHMMRDTTADPLAAYRATNVTGALRVAGAARRAGARRFVFVSSIKAVAESSAGWPIAETDQPAPTDPYGISKLEAERALIDYGARSGMEIVIVRPPLVYGPGVRANFLQLMSAIARGIPLPLGAIDARRSLVFVDNLADALVHCTTDPRAAGQTFNVTDGRDLSVAELARALATQLHAPARLVRVPVAVLRLAGRITGRSAPIDRLIGELRLDSSHICERLGWYPPHTVEHGLLETAAWYRATH